MFCEVRDLMERNEQFARGWIRLYGHENTSTVISMGKYAVSLCKLKREHQKECFLCRQGEENVGDKQPDRTVAENV